MEVRIGVQHVAREVVLESEQTADEVRDLVGAAMKSGEPLVLADERGHTVTVAGSALAYVDVASETARRVGFGG